MNIEGIIWLRTVVDKLAFKHHVETHEVEEVFVGRPKFRLVERGEREARTSTSLSVGPTLGDT